MRRVRLGSESIWLNVCAVGMAVVAGGCAPDPNADVGSTTQKFAIAAQIWDGTCVPEYFTNPPGSGVVTTCSYPRRNGPPTTSMHCCPYRYAMSGLYNQSNDFKCSQIIPDNVAEVDCYEEDTNTRSLSGSPAMRACPVNYYMKGFYAGSGSKLICCLEPNLRQGSRLDGKPLSTTLEVHHFGNSPTAGNCSFDHTVHVCQLGGGPQSEVMVGVHINNEDFICEW